MSEIINLKRRNFLKGSAAAAAGVTLASTSAYALSAYEDAQSQKKKKKKTSKTLNIFLRFVECALICVEQ